MMKPPKRILRCSVLVLAIVLLACSEPVPPDKSNYVGLWQSNEMSLLILQDGSVKYERLKRGSTVKVTGPLQAFHGDGFVVGFSFIKTTFVVSEPPHLEDGVWKMVVDGVELTRAP